MKIEFNEEQKLLFRWGLIVALVLITLFMAIFFIFKAGGMIFKDRRAYEQKLEDYLVQDCSIKTRGNKTTDPDVEFIVCIDGVKKFMGDRIK